MIKQKNKIKNIGFCICGSFCTIAKAIEQMEKLVKMGYRVLPIMSETAYSTDTRFGKAKDIVKKVEKICDRKIIHTIKDAEPIGPKNLTDIMIVAPCTGNTLGKLANAITDTSVTMAVKSHLRGQKSVIIALATNDALAGSAKNIATLTNRKFFHFIPTIKDDKVSKPASLIAKFEEIYSFFK